MDVKVSYVKAIGLLLMVLGHAIANVAGCQFLYDCIYLFHMPLFFFCSGYFFKEAYIERPHEFVKKKIKGLWLPYVKWCLLFIILHDLLLSINFYDIETSTAFGNPYKFKDYAVMIINALLFKYNSAPLLGGFWFIGQLFWSSVIACAFLFILKKMRIGFKSSIMLAILILCIGASVIAIIEKSIPVIGINQRTFFCASMFLLGKLYSLFVLSYKDVEYNALRYSKLIIVGKILISVIVILIVAYTGIAGHDSSLYTTKEWSLIPMKLLVQFIAIIGCFAIADVILKSNHVVQSVLAYIGNHTMPICAIHFSAFKLVTLLMLFMYNMELEKIAEFPTPYYNGAGWICCYVVVATGLSLLLNYFYCIAINKVENLKRIITNNQKK